MDWTPLIPAVELTLGILAVLVIDLLSKGRHPYLPVFVALVALLGAAASALLQPTSGKVVLGVLQVDRFSVVFTVFCCATGFVTLLSTMRGEAFRKPGSEFLALVLAAVLGMNMLAMSVDIVSLYLAFETISIPSYVLVAMRRADPRSNEAGVKYVLFGAVASAVMLYGLSMIVGMAGGTSFAALREAIATRGRHGTAHVDRGLRHGVLGLRLQDLRRAVPLLGARRLRRGTGVGRRLPGRRLQGRRLHGLAAPRRTHHSPWRTRCGRSARHPASRWRRVGDHRGGRGDPHDDGGESGRAAPAGDQAPARVVEHRPRRLSPAGPRGVQRGGAGRVALLPRGLPLHEPRGLPHRGTRDPGPGHRGDHRPAGAGPQARRPGAGLRHRALQPDRSPAVLRLRGQAPALLRGLREGLRVARCDRPRERRDLALLLRTRGGRHVPRRRRGPAGYLEARMGGPHPVRRPGDPAPRLRVVLVGGVVVGAVRRPRSTAADRGS